MVPMHPTRWWIRKRVLVPAAALLALVTTLWAAWLRSGTTRVVVYNETGTNWPVLLVTAGGKVGRFSQVADEASVRLNLRGATQTTEIVLYIDSTNEPAWKGGVVDPSVGERHILRVQRSGDVELSTISSFIHGLLGE